MPLPLFRVALERCVARGINRWDDDFADHGGSILVAVGASRLG
jgi:hypothetical protein